MRNSRASIIKRAVLVLEQGFLVEKTTSYVRTLAGEERGHTSYRKLFLCVVEKRQVTQAVDHEERKTRVRNDAMFHSPK